MSPVVSLSATIHGRVQGVFFRAFIERQASNLGLACYARNLPGGRSVEVVAEGERNKLEELINLLKVGPPGARVDKVDIEWGEYARNLDSFRVVE